MVSTVKIPAQHVSNPHKGHNLRRMFQMAAVHLFT